jgi:serine/threonine-protein kinase
MVEPGTIVDGRYQVISRVGSGGMADVYLAEDQLLGRQVALKVLHHHFAEDHEFVERFKREASSAAGLSHPNIVAIFDRGEWNGTYYIAMEYVAGRSLKSVVREEGAMEPGRAIDVVIQIVRAARFAHRRGIIHRDLKPHNVILDEEGRARVTDFGIARAGASDMTLTGSIMGTAQYLSPEQAQGHAVTSASDIYSVGVLLYELLTGSVPFEGETAVAIAYQQVAAAPRPPSELNPGIPPSLDAVVLRALAKDPAERFVDDDELIAALEAELAALPAYSEVAYAMTAVAAPPEPPGPPPAAGLLMAPAAAPEADGEPPDERRRRVLWWTLAGLAAAAVVALALLLLLQNGSGVSVPNVVGQSEQEASLTLSHAGLVPVPSLQSSTSVPAGRVISQSPAAGSAVSKGAHISFAVSAGPGVKGVPDVEGLSAEQAEAKLRTAGFKPARKSEANTKVAPGKVIGTSPSAGTETQLGSTVTVIVSSGPAPVKVPNVVGQSRSGAEATLEDAGLAVGAVSSKVAANQPPGTVISQTPAAGSSVHAGEKVSLTVAQASNEVRVPGVVGKGEAPAAAALGAAGLTPRAVTVTTAEPSQVGVVLTQSPSAGAKARKGAVVTIGVGTLGPPTTPTTPTTPSTNPATTPSPSPPAG